MPTHATPAQPILRMTLRIQIGESRMAGSDDPLFLGFHGQDGREFRIRFASGASLRRGAEEHYRLGPAGDADTNVANAEFNDPTSPPIDAARIQSVYLRKGFEPVPNVRGFGEMDDRLEVVEVELELHAAGRAKPLRFLRRGPLWLGLLSGLRLDLPRVDEGE
ncbi:MAG TPA: hypothetical protein VII72_22205 [Myxococcota bacterium]|jgi:hypothetical protein